MSIDMSNIFIIEAHSAVSKGLVVPKSLPHPVCAMHLT